MGIKKIALFFCSFFLVACPKPKVTVLALPGCEDAPLDQTRASLEGTAKRQLDKKDLAGATASLKKAACYDGKPDLLLLDLAARAVLVDLIEHRIQAKEAASTLLNTAGGKEQLIELAQKANPSVAVSLWAALAERQDQVALLPLQELAKEPDHTTKIAAMRALLRLGALSKEDAVAALASDNPQMRALGVEIAARYDTSLLKQAVEDKDSSVRAAVVYSLPTLPTEEAGDLASLLIFDDDIGVRLAAFELAMQLGAAKEETITVMLQGKDPLLALAAARIAGPENKEAIKVLLVALDNPGLARRNALLLCGAFKPAAADIVPKLYTVINTAETDERVLAATALLQLEPVLPAGKQAREAQDEANETLSAACAEGGRPGVRGCAELAPRGDENAKQRLRTQILKDPDPIARSAALRALGLFGQAYVGDIAAALNDEDGAVRLVAAQQILKIVGATPKPFGRQ